MRNHFRSPLRVVQTDGTAIANTTTETIIFPDVPIPANYFEDNRVLCGTAFGKHSTTGTPTLTFAVRAGGVAGTLLATTEAITCGSGVTNMNWFVEYWIQTRTNGASGALLAWGLCHLHTAAGTVLSNVFGVSGHDAPANVSVDLTAAFNLSLTADWSAASASNTLTGMHYVVEGPN